MKKAKHEKKIDTIINKTIIARPAAFAEAYKDYKKTNKNKLNLPLSPSGILKEVITRREKAIKEKPNEQHDVLYQTIKQDYNQIISIAKSSLYKETKKLLQDNYNSKVITAIYETLYDFKHVLIINSDASKTMDTLLSSKETPQKFKKAIQACNDLLRSGTLYNYEMSILESIKQRNECQISAFKEIEMNPVKKLSLYMNRATGLLTSYDVMKYSEEVVNRGYYNIIPKKEVGRPRDIFVKALQIAIYRQLVDVKPKNKYPYIDWAKTLTANIINEYFEKGKDIAHWRISAKDIDNSLHSS